MDMLLFLSFTQTLRPAFASSLRILPSLLFMNTHYTMTEPFFTESITVIPQSPSVPVWLPKVCIHLQQVKYFNKVNLTAVISGGSQ